MKIQSLTINNFLTIGRAELELDGKGLVLIQGKNKDDHSALSNGSGKSSIPDALCWALYGRTARGISSDAVINRLAGKNCLVQVKITEGDSAWRITRGRKHSTYKNRLVLEVDKEGEWKDISKGTDKETQILVDQVLGCSHDVFSSAIYAGQEQMPNLPAMTDKQLKVLIEEAAGINLIERAYELAREKHSKVNGHRVDLEIVRDKVSSKLDSIKDAIDTAEKDMDRWISDWDARIEAVKEEIKSCAKECHKAKEKYDEARHKEVDAKIAELEKKLDASKEEGEELDGLVGDEREANRDLAKAEGIVQMAVDVTRQKKTDLKSVDDRVGTPCTQCGKTYTSEDLDAARKLAQKEVDKALYTLRETKKRLDAARSRSQIAQDARESFQRSMTNVSDVLAAQRILRSERDGLIASGASYVEQKRKAQALGEKYKQMQAEENPFRGLIEKYREDAERLEKKIASTLKEIAEAEAVVKVHQDAMEVFGPVGVRAHILDTVTPFLNDRTADYLGTLSDGNISATWSTITKTAKGELREKFNIEVYNDKGSDNFAGLSGGEKRKVRLSCAMALQDLVASRAAKPIDLFVADEIDDALDEAGLERLMSILDIKAKERGTVLVISHNELSDWIRESVTVVKEGGHSIIEGSALS